MNNELPCAGCRVVRQVCDKHQPEPGDFVVCIDCGLVNVFSDDLELRIPTQDEITGLMFDDDFNQYVHMVADYIRHQKAKLN